LKGASSPQEICEKAKEDPGFRERLLVFISQVVSETMPKEMVDEVNPGVGEQVFQPFANPEDPYFDDTAQIHVYDIIQSRNMHKRTHTPTCFKYGNKRKCRTRYPRK